MRATCASRKIPYLPAAIRIPKRESVRTERLGEAPRCRVITLPLANQLAMSKGSSHRHERWFPGRCCTNGTALCTTPRKPNAELDNPLGLQPIRNNPTPLRPAFDGADARHCAILGQSRPDLGERPWPVGHTPFAFAGPILKRGHDRPKPTFSAAGTRTDTSRKMSRDGRARTHPSCSDRSSPGRRDISPGNPAMRPRRVRNQ